MESSFLLNVGLPVVLAIIMFGMGLSLEKRDFTRLAKMPLPVIAGLSGQIIILPLIAYLVVIAFDLSPALAVGMMILSACPGGTMSNVISQICRANLALSVTLTAITTVICVFTTPLIIGWSIAKFDGETAREFSLASTTIGLIVITLIPVLIGIVTRSFATAWAIKYEEYFRRFSGVFMLVMIVFVLRENWTLFVESFEKVALATMALNIGAICTGLLLGLLLGLSRRDGVTLSIEVGIQNATVAITIAATFLQQEAYAVTAGVYGITMYLGALIPVLLMRKENKLLEE